MGSGSFSAPYRLLPEQPQLAQEARCFPAELGLVGAQGVEAGELDGGGGVDDQGVVVGGVGEVVLGLIGQDFGLQPVGALLLPQGGGETADELGRELGRRCQVLDQVGEELLVGGVVLAFEEEVAGGGEAMLQGVAGGAGLALGRGGTAGVPAVAAGGVGLGGGAGGGHRSSAAGMGLPAILAEHRNLDQGQLWNGKRPPLAGRPPREALVLNGSSW